MKAFWVLLFLIFTSTSYSKTIFNCDITNFSSQNTSSYPAQDLYSSMRLDLNSSTKATLWGSLRSDGGEVIIGEQEEEDLVVSQWKDMYYMKMVNDWGAPEYELILLKADEKRFQGKLEVWGHDRQTYILNCRLLPSTDVIGND